MAYHQGHTSPTSARFRASSDPLSAAIAPPPDETPTQRERRLREEEEARRRSESIDRMLKEGERHQRRKKTVKVLLLGQSESGKSTTLKRKFLLIQFISAVVCSAGSRMGRILKGDEYYALYGVTVV